MAEIKTIEADVIGFADDIFTADMDWVERVCDLIIKEGIKKEIRHKCSIRSCEEARCSQEDV